MQRSRGGLALKAYGLCASLNSRHASNTEVKEVVSEVASTPLVETRTTHCCRANMARVRESRPDSSPIWLKAGFWPWLSCTGPYNVWRCLLFAREEHHAPHTERESLAVPGAFARTAAVCCDVAAPAITGAKLLRNGDFHWATTSDRVLKPQKCCRW